MICLDCDNENYWHTEVKAIPQDFHGILVTVETEVTVCDHCGWYTVTPPQADLLLEKTRAAVGSYRLK